MKHISLFSIVLVAAASFLTGCPPTETGDPLMASLVWQENGRQFTEQLYQFEMVDAPAGAVVRFENGQYESGTIKYKLFDFPEVIVQDLAIEQKEIDQKCSNCLPYSYYCPTCYDDADEVINNITIDDNDPPQYGGVVVAIAGQVVVYLVATVIEGLESGSTAIPDQFAIVCPMGPMVEMAVVEVQTSAGQFAFTLKGGGGNTEGEDENEYTLTTSVVGQGTVTGGGTYAKGTVVPVTATPASGWSFDHWTANGTQGSSNPVAQVTMDSDVNLVATFTQNQQGQNFVLTTSVVGQGTVTGGGSYAKGTVVSVTATPASGWSFDHWTANGTQGSSNPVAQVTMDSDVNLVATFTQNQQGQNFVLTTSVVGQGTVTGAGTYAKGTVVPVTATPANGWKFEHWTVNGSTGSSNTNAQVTMDSDVNLVAVFSQNGVIPAGLTIALTWTGSQLNLAASGATAYNVIGLELYHTAGGAPWVQRATYAVNSSGCASGTVSEFRYSASHILRFSVVSTATSGGYVPNENVTCTFAGSAVPLVDDGSGNLAFQVTVQ